MESCDIVIIGGGIAGVSAAAFLAPHAKVIVLEREARVFHHSSSRSTSQYTVGIHRKIMRQLAQAARAFFCAPDPEIAEGSLLSPRGCLAVGTAAQEERLTLLQGLLRDASASCERVTGQEINSLFPALKQDRFDFGVFEPGAMDIDSERLMQGYVRKVNRHKSIIRTNACISGIRKTGRRWVVRCADGAVTAPLLLNSAGAWADEITRISGLKPLGLTPYLRNAFSFVAPWQAQDQIWPHLYSVNYNWYIHPQNSYFIGSLADATPTTAFDAFADDQAVAQAIYNIHEDTHLKVQRPLASWAGLRTFTQDRNPVVGPSVEDKSYFYAVGLGGCGVLTSPAVGSAIAAQMLGQDLPAPLREVGLTKTDLAAARIH